MGKKVLLFFISFQEGALLLPCTILISSYVMTLLYCEFQPTQVLSRVGHTTMSIQEMSKLPCYF